MIVAQATLATVGDGVRTTRQTQGDVEWRDHGAPPRCARRGSVLTALATLMETTPLPLDLRVSRSTTTSLSCHPATLPPCHPATLTTLPTCHPATLPPCHHATLQPCNPATLQPCNPTTLQPCPAFTLPRCGGCRCFWLPVLLSPSTTAVTQPCYCRCCCHCHCCYCWQSAVAQLLSPCLLLA